MPSPANPPPFVAAAICCVVGLGSWGFYVTAFRDVPGQDWMVFYTAAHAYLDGRLASVLDANAFMVALNQNFSAWLGTRLSLHPWVYPPTFLMLFLPFGILPQLLSYVAFMLTGFIAVMVALRICIRNSRTFPLHATALALSPAAAFTVCVGQNAFWTTALLLGGTACVATRPILAGILFGLLSFKPQLCLMVPVALIAAQQWRVIASGTLTCIGLAIASVIVFGQGFWLSWFATITGHDALYQQWEMAGRLSGMSVYACATLLGASADLAQAIQVFAALVGATAVFTAFRHDFANELRLPVLLTATFLAAPHVSNYEAMMLVIAATIFVLWIPRDASQIPKVITAVLVWLCPIVNPPVAFPIGALTPLLTAGFLGMLVAQGLRYSPRLNGALPRRNQASLDLSTPLP